MQDKNRCKLMRCKMIALLLIAFLFWIDKSPGEEPDWCRHLPRSGYAKLQKVTVDSKWFEVHLIQPGLYAISEPRQYEEVISYLLVGSNRALLWDTGMGISKIEPLVTKLSGVPVIVLNSHTHPDHIGGNYEFQEIWGMQTDFTKQNQDGYSDPEMKKWVATENICGELPEGFQPAKYAIKPFRISRYVKDREIIDLGGRQVEVVSTPGHTPDSICLVDRKNRLMFTGDTFYPGPIYLYSPETNFDQYAQSVELMAQFQESVDTLLTAHNEPMAAASLLSTLKSAVEQIQRGEMKPMDQNGLDEYFFQTFSILLKKK